MSNVIRYAAVNTKIRAIEGRFLSDEDYKALLSMSSVQDIIRYLKGTSYKEAFAGADESSIHRGQLEFILKRYAIDILIRLNNYFQDRYCRFLQVLFMRYEAEDLKVLIRALNTGRSYVNSPESFIYIGRYGELKLDKLAASRSFADLTANLKGTPYYEFLAPLALKGAHGDQFQIEMALDMAYISTYKKRLKLLSPAEQRKVAEIQGMRSDLFNLQWIYRGKKFYNLSPELLLNYTIDFEGRLKYGLLKELCYTKDIKALEDRMKDSEYGFLFQHDTTKDLFMERRIHRYLYYKLLKYKRMNTMDIVQTVAFFDLLETEIRDIITIVENVRYQYEEPDQRKRFLIREL